MNAIHYQIDAFAYYHSTAIPTTIEETPVDVIAEDSLEQSFIAEELTDTIIAEREGLGSLLFLHCFGPANNFQNFLGDGSLSGLVIMQCQFF